MRCMWLLLLHCRPPKETNIFCATTKATIFVERSQSWTKVMIPKPMLWKTADGGRGSKARGGKWKNMLIVSSHPIMALATRGSWPGSSGKSIYSRKAVLYFLYMWLCIEDGDTNAAASITDREVCAAGRNMVSEVLEVGLWLVICWRSIFVHCSKISTSFSWLHRSQTKNQHGRV